MCKLASLAVTKSLSPVDETTTPLPCRKDRRLELDVVFSETVQRRVDKAYKAWVKGEVAIMQNRDTSKFVQYRKEAKPVMQRSTGLELVNGQFKVSVGVKPKYDYSVLTLDEQLKRG